MFQMRAWEVKSNTMWKNVLEDMSDSYYTRYAGVTFKKMYKMWMNGDESRFIFMPTFGMKDKNEKWMYLFDYVELEEEDGDTFIDEIIFEDGMFLLKEKQEPVKIYKGKMTVIGNRFENPRG